MKQITIVATSLVLLTLTISNSSASRILALFSHPGPSHFKFFHPLLLGLAKSGHDVTVVGYFPNKNPIANYTDFPIEGITSRDAIDVTMMEKKSFLGNIFEFLFVFQWGLMSCEKFLESPAIQKVLKAKPYDLVLVENFNTECTMGVTHFLKAPIIGLSSCVLLPWEYKKHGVFYSPSHNSFNLHGVDNKLSFFHRTADWFVFHGLNLAYDMYFRPKTNTIVKKYLGDNIPDVGELASDIHLTFVNQHFASTGVRSVPSNVIEVGGLHIDKPKQLELEIKRILDGAKNGVVYISWGSQVRAQSLPEAKRDEILRAIGRLEEQVLWKWENETIPNSPKNLYIRKWMPQQEILCHPNVKVFVSHGGLLGTSEAIYCGVPIVVIPLFGDQFINAAVLKAQGVASSLTYSEISEETIYQAIKEVLRPEIYKNAKEASSAFKDRPMQPLELTIWWVNRVIETKGRIFAKSNLSKTSWIVYYSVDVYFFLSTILIASVLFDIWIIKMLCSRKSKNSVKENKVKRN